MGSVDPHWSLSLVGIDPPCLSGQLIKSEGRMKRRRAATLAIDVAGYSVGWNGRQGAVRLFAQSA
jgi:hypothetical protein